MFLILLTNYCNRLSFLFFAVFFIITRDKKCHGNTHDVNEGVKIEKMSSSMFYLILIRCTIRSLTATIVRLGPENEITLEAEQNKRVSL